MTNITTIRLDLAKSVFQFHCADRDGDSGDSLLNPFIRLSVPLLRHENPARSLLQHLH